MKSDPRCAPCLLNRVHYEADLSTKDEALRFKAIQGGAEYLAKNFKPGSNAIKVSTGIHRAAYAILGDDDPYREMKALSNRLAAAMVPKVREYIDSAPSADRFRIAVLASIIGNTFDFGVQGHDVKTDDFDAFFEEMFSHGLDVDDTDAVAKLAAGKDVVYLADNCGEIYFDELVIERLNEMGARVNLVVRGGYILTDATMDDVKAMRLDEKAHKISTTGSNAIGISVEEAPKELLQEMRDASVIISKGMANYEALSEEDFKPIAYLMRAKCEPVAKSLGVKKGMNVAKLIK